jgi:hypothetical protein
MPGRVVITPAHWIGCICGKRCAIRVEPGARRLGEGGGSVDVVQRGSALRSGSAEQSLGFGVMAEKLDLGNMVLFPQASGSSSFLYHKNRGVHTIMPPDFNRGSGPQVRVIS